MSPEQVRRIGGYTLIEPLGSGGSGTVWRAIPDVGGSPVAFKLLHLVGENSETERKQLLREAQLVNAIKLPADAPGSIARIIDVETEGVYAFIVSELIPGQTLAKKLEAGALSQEQVLDLGHALANILEHVHAARIAHRDLKPSNVILSRRGPVLIDFGIARTDRGESVTRTGLVRGTPGFVSPEVLQGQAASFADWVNADWYAFVALLLQSLTGRPPFGAGQLALYQQLRGRPDVEGLSEPLQNWFRAALAVNPAERVNYSDLLAAIDADWRNDWAEDETEDEAEDWAHTSEDNRGFDDGDGAATEYLDAASLETYTDYTDGQETQFLSPHSEDVTQLVQSTDKTLYLPEGNGNLATDFAPTVTLSESLAAPTTTLPPSFSPNSANSDDAVPIASSKRYGARSSATQNPANDSSAPIFSSPFSASSATSNSGERNSVNGQANQRENPAAKSAKLREISRIHFVPTAIFCALISLLPVVLDLMGWALSALLSSGIFAIGISYWSRWRKVRMGQEPSEANPLTLPLRMILGLIALIPGAALGSIVVKVVELAGQAINGNLPTNFQIQQLWDFLLIQTSDSTNTYLTDSNTLIYWLACWFITFSAIMFPSANSVRQGLGVIVDRFCKDRFQKLLVWILLAIVVVLAGAVTLGVGFN